MSTGLQSRKVVCASNAQGGVPIGHDGNVSELDCDGKRDDRYIDVL